MLEGITYSKDFGYDFGYGRWLVSEKRFADALRFLTKVYELLKNVVVADFDRGVNSLRRPVSISGSASMKWDSMSMPPIILI